MHKAQKVLGVKWSECKSKHSKHYLELCKLCEV